MELLYIWINKNNNGFINNQGINFYGKHRFSLKTEENPKRYVLSYAPMQDSFNIFNIGCVKNITVLVGENGAGKTTLFSCLYSGGCLPRQHGDAPEYERNITTVAYALSRIIICRIQPTLSKEDMQIFISHRRIDGEDLAVLFYNEFRIRAESAFRDLIDIRIGEDAQEIIEENLKKSDVVIFIDTPKSGESYWIKRELSIALSLNIPIVWVKVGDLEHRTPLDVKPADAPHFYYDDTTLSNISTDSSLIDNIIHKAFRISRESAKHVFDRIHLLKSIAKDNGITLKKIDSKNMIYRVEIPRKGFRYYQKPIIQIVQCYGRRPKDDECLSIVPILEGLGYITHPEYGPYFDTTIFLSPIKENEVNNSVNFVTESFDSYLYYLEKYLNPEKHRNSNEKGIIISGAFPDCEPDYQQYLTDAVYSLTKSIFQCNGKVIFGAHPTFQHLIFDMGKMYRPGDYQDAIRLYCISAVPW